MSTTARSKLQPRLSYKLCAQRIACDLSEAKATSYCADCNCVQCDNCNQLVHEHTKNIFHKPTPIPETDQRLVCSKKPCIYLADIICNNCRKKYCCKCDQEFHSRKEKSYHLKKPFDPDLKEEADDQFLSLDEDQYYSLAEDSTMMQQMYTPDVVLNAENSLGDSNSVISSSDYPTSPIGNAPSFHLVDNSESLMIDSEAEFINKLGCKPNTLLKVVSIFGNTGDGKSYTLNHSCFEGREVFSTSASQESCTMGVWAAFDPTHSILALDTEGLMGQTHSDTQRHRLLLKILAISDVVIYRTRAARLTTDLFNFLGNASHIFLEYFKEELETLAKQHSIPNLSSLGPSVIIFHETTHTEILNSDGGKRPEEKLAQTFAAMQLKVDAFNQLEYVGVRTPVGVPTDFKSFVSCLERHLKNKLRMARLPGAVYQAVKSLNLKFSKDIETKTFTGPKIFDSLFQCRQHCLSCNLQCTKNDNHQDEHDNPTLCTFKSSFNNQILLCKTCYNNQRRTVVDYKSWENKENTVVGSLNYLLSGSVLECPTCGPIYRSRSSWWGNQEPWETNAVKQETVHVWVEPGKEEEDSNHTARKFIDVVEDICDTLSDVSKLPTTYVGSIMAESVKPSYWQPNSEIKNCNVCEKKLKPEEIHHCRVCGKGVCQTCSPDTRKIAKWKFHVRVCEACNKPEISAENISNDTTIREAGEIIQTGASAVNSAVQYALGVFAETCVGFANPSYWTPNHLIKCCVVCENKFGDKLKLHHCRRCGEGVCSNCSKHREPVPERKFYNKVRVCNSCHIEQS